MPIPRATQSYLTPAGLHTITRVRNVGSTASRDRDGASRVRCPTLAIVCAIGAVQERATALVVVRR